MREAGVVGIENKKIWTIIAFAKKYPQRFELIEKETERI